MTSSGSDPRQVLVTVLQQCSNQPLRISQASQQVHQSSSSARQPTSDVPSYSYHVKLVNSTHKKNSIIRELRKFHRRFKSVMEMKIRLINDLEEHMPETTKFSLKYIEGRQSTKRWICCEDDLNAMYTTYISCPHKAILLWYDSGGIDEEPPNNKKRKTSDAMSKCEETKQRIAAVAEELREMQEDKLKLSEVQFRLWARMLVTGVHSSKETPLQITMITGSTPRHQMSQKDLQESIISTAASVVKAVTQNSPSSSVVQSPQVNQTVGESVRPHCSQALDVSPGKVSEIRGKSYSQQATLKQLYEDVVLMLSDFEEQKEMILVD